MGAVLFGFFAGAISVGIALLKAWAAEEHEWGILLPVFLIETAATIYGVFALLMWAAHHTN